MLPRIVVHCMQDLPNQHLWAWLRQEQAGCTQVDLDQDDNLRLRRGTDPDVKYLSTVGCLKSLGRTDPVVSIPLLYEFSTGLDHHNETSIMMVGALGKELGVDFGVNYVRWYAKPRVLAFDTAVKVQHIKTKLVDFVPGDVRGDTTVLWRFSKWLRGTLAEHLKVRALGHGE